MAAAKPYIFFGFAETQYSKTPYFFSSAPKPHTFFENHIFFLKPHIFFNDRFLTENHDFYVQKTIFQALRALLICYVMFFLFSKFRRVVSYHNIIILELSAGRGRPCPAIAFRSR